MQGDDKDCTGQRLEQSSHTETSRPQTAPTSKEMQQMHPASGVYKAWLSDPALTKLVKMWPKLSKNMQESIIKLIEASVAM